MSSTQTDETSVGSLVRKLENEYIRGSTLTSKYVNFSMYDTLNTTDAYLNSRHTSGETDSLGREKPFFNIVTAAVNIWYRATDIDRKDIRFVPQTNSSVVLAFAANVLLQKWMDENNFGQFLNDWGRSLARNGSSVIRSVDNDKGFSLKVEPWSRMIVDPIEFDPNPKIKVMELTPGQLQKRVQTNGYDKDAVKDLIATHAERSERKTIGRQNRDNRDGYIKLYEIHGELQKSLLTNKEDDAAEYVQQMHVISFVGSQDGRRKNDFKDFTLFEGLEKVDPHMITSLIKEDGRTLAIGAVEHLFNAQWMANHTVKNTKDVLDLSSRLIFQTADEKFLARNVLTEIETGDIFVHKDNMPITRIANDKPDVAALMNFQQMWQNLGTEITSTPDALRGNTMPSGTPFSLGAFLGGQANSLFEIMTENKGLHVEQMMRKFVIPNLKKQLKNADEISGILDDAGVTEIDAIYIPKEAVRRFNERSTEQILNGETPDVFDREIEEAGIRESLGQLGNKRFFKPDELGKKTWSELLSDFQWENIKVEVTNENVDKGVILQTLSSVLQTIASNPAILQDPNAKTVFAAILNETGAISPIQLSQGAPQAQPAQVGGGAAPEQLPTPQLQQTNA